MINAILDRSLADLGQRAKRNAQREAVEEASRRR